MRSQVRYVGTQLDEVVVEGDVVVHLEHMGSSWCLIVSPRAGGDTINVDLRSKSGVVVEAPADMVEVRK